MEWEQVLSQGDLRIPCRIFQPEGDCPRRVVLGVHGIGGSKDDAIQSSIAEEMAMFGCATVRFDFPAHGESPMDSEFFTVESCMAALEAAAREACDRFPEAEHLCIFASGFGAYITLLSLQNLCELPLPLRLVVQTPAVLMHETLLKMAGVTPQTLWAMDEMTLPTPRPLTIRYSLYESLQRHIALTTHPVPMLILQGENDRFIRLSDIQQFRRINEQSRLVIIPGTSHRFEEDGAWDMVLDLTRDWFEFQQVFLSDWI